MVEDHAAAIDQIYHEGRNEETYNIGGNNEWKNIDLILLLCKIMDEKLGREKGTSAKLITYVTDRAGHDLRYAIDSSKLQNELGWAPRSSLPKASKKNGRLVPEQRGMAQQCYLWRIFKILRRNVQGQVTRSKIESIKKTRRLINRRVFFV